MKINKMIIIGNKVYNVDDWRDRLQRKCLESLILFNVYWTPGYTKMERTQALPLGS